ncbi:uncharacterized protein [Temnothorax longispinosus]|uniref:uncharacterized protein n=1 Tax=Temnothorax longispinosus TaxID=300112 RepID=UPI003A997099
MQSYMWTNTHFDILKAAVAKYGKHQWGRVATLLPGHNAMMCEARWHQLQLLEQAQKEEEARPDPKDMDQDELEMLQIFVRDVGDVGDVVARVTRQAGKLCIR